MARPIPTIIAVGTRETQESDPRVASWFMVSAGWIEAVRGRLAKVAKFQKLFVVQLTQLASFSCQEAVLVYEVAIVSR